MESNDTIILPFIILQEAGGREGREGSEVIVDKRALAGLQL